MHYLDDTARLLQDPDRLREVMTEYVNDDRTVWADTWTQYGLAGPQYASSDPQWWTIGCALQSLRELWLNATIRAREPHDPFAHTWWRVRRARWEDEANHRDLLVSSRFKAIVLKDGALTTEVGVECPSSHEVLEHWVRTGAVKRDAVWRDRASCPPSLATTKNFKGSFDAEDWPVINALGVYERKVVDGDVDGKVQIIKTVLDRVTQGRVQTKGGTAQRIGALAGLISMVNGQCGTRYTVPPKAQRIAVMQKLVR